jgi:hypothetical protein
MLTPVLVLAAGVEMPATDRTIQFLTNAHTGISMNDSEWLSAEARRAGNIAAHGGLSRLVNQTTAFAREYKGLMSIAILEVTEQGKVQRIRAEVKFFDEKRRRASAAAAEREDMIWTFVVRKEDGAWKLQF